MHEYQPKLIAIDMDGTLLNRHSVISAGNADAIRRSLAQGHKVVIATGRSESDARLLLTQAHLSLPVISSNGAQVRDANGALLTCVPLPPAFTAALLGFAQALQIYTELFDLPVTYHSADGRELLRREYTERLADGAADDPAFGDDAWEWAERQLTQHSLVPTPDLKTKGAEPEVTPLKVLTFSFRRDSLAALTARVEEWGGTAGLDEIAVSQSSRFNLEFTHRDAQKGVAVTAMAHRLGIPLSESVAIGDSPNDLSMFAVVGRSIAMADAAPMIQERCDLVTGFSDDDGVAYALEHLLGD